MREQQPQQADTGTDAGLGLRCRRLGAADLIWVQDGGPEPCPEWFDPQWLERNDRLRGMATGRGTTHFAVIDGREVVLRHYRRGGLLRDLLGDRYLWTGLRRSRPWRELAVQAQLYGRGLPVPRPVAGLVRRDRQSSLFYRADLLTERLPRTRTLAQCLRAERLERPVWHDIGQVIARFHEAGLEHADLNAHNILIDDAGQIALIDFDRAVLHAGPGKWSPANLHRLRRSLDKLQAEDAALAFSNGDWDRLTAGYESARRASAAVSASASRISAR